MTAADKMPLGYLISHGEIKPDPERMKPLREIPPSKEQEISASCYRDVLVLFAEDTFVFKQYQSASEKQTFHLLQYVKHALNSLKKLLECYDCNIRPERPLVVGTDQSDISVAASLSRNNLPVAFPPCTLTVNERRHSAVKEEACAIV